jgi:hypothetical protein
VHDRHQLAQGLAELGAELHELVPLLRRHLHAARQLRAEDLVLDLQVADLAGQLFQLTARSDYGGYRTFDSRVNSLRERGWLPSNVVAAVLHQVALPVHVWPRSMPVA